MRGPAGVLDLMGRGMRWWKRATALIETNRRRRRALALARTAQRAGQGTFRRTWIEAEVAARLAVRSGVRVDDFLRARVARYAAALPVPLDDLGVDVNIENGELVVRARPTRQASGAANPAPVAELPPEIQAARAQVSLLNERVNAARARVDALARQVADDLATGKLPAAPGQVDASLEQCGRPPVPLAAPALLLRALSLALLASAAYRMASPALALAGISTEDLASALSRDPISALAGVLFGMGGAVSVYAFLNVAVERWQDLITAASAGRKPIVLTLAGGAAVALSAAVALAAINPGLMAGPLLLVCVPLAAVLLLRQASRLEGERRLAAAAALEWDRARAREAGERNRRAEAVAGAEAALAAAVRDHGEAEERLRALEKRSVEEARLTELIAADSARRVERLAEALAASLELDRYAFLRRAAVVAREEGAIRPIRSRPSAVDRSVDGLEAAG